MSALTPETTLLIGGFCGLLIGYSSGFLIVRMIYRRKPARL